MNVEIEFYFVVCLLIRIFAHRTMNACSFMGLGCPRSEELSGSWRLFFCLWLLRIDLESHQLVIFLEDVGF